MVSELRRNARGRARWDTTVRYREVAFNFVWFGVKAKPLETAGIHQPPEREVGGSDGRQNSRYTVTSSVIWLLGVLSARVL